MRICLSSSGSMAPMRKGRQLWRKFAGLVAQLRHAGRRMTDGILSPHPPPGRTMQRKPMWQVAVSMPWARRAAGR